MNKSASSTAGEAARCLTKLLVGGEASHCSGECAARNRWGQPSVAWQTVEFFCRFCIFHGVIEPSWLGRRLQVSGCHHWLQGDSCYYRRSCISSDDASAGHGERGEWLSVCSRAVVVDHFNYQGNSLPPPSSTASSASSSNASLSL